MNTNDSQQRQFSLTVLAKSAIDDIRKYWEEVGISPTFEFLKKPEVGMVMVRAKAGVDGQDFNMGEMTVTRCIVQLTTNEIGYGYTKGRDKDKSELIALIDACLQISDIEKTIMKSVIEPLNIGIIKENKAQENKVEKSKVNFFTMVRGE